MGKMDIGMVGMAVMGSNLALNMADHGFDVACYNYTPDLTEKVLREHPHEHMHGFFDLREFVQSLKRPRRIMLLIMAGDPVDSMIDQLMPLLEEGDIILDGGNSFFEDTIRRQKKLADAGLHYFGVGISGGEKGARNGPCIMPGGDAATYEAVRPIYEAVAARAADGEPCCAYIGTDGAGHFVKMVHNGIEYADMQLIAEAYLLLKYAGGFTNERIAAAFRQWNQGELKSFLIGITADIFAEDDEDGGQVVDKILDSAGQKGTGRWTSIEALKRGVNTSLITAACNARVMSNLWDLRRGLGQRFAAVKAHEPLGDDFAEIVRKSLYVGKIAAYAQGFALYQAAASHYGWKLDFGRIAGIFRGGCIIQADFLERITEAFQSNAQLENLMEANFFAGKIQANLDSLREVVALGVKQGLPIPAMACAIEYIDSARAAHVGANLIQAQRDYFGAHTYNRVDKEGVFHHQWN
ncbi:putative 6-phosphogluconate dehydrogenase, decarboxylating [Selenomonas ruminantium subsp. lactilytica TAM6421]|uniref:6-phosphogluconate dehydrogenase, decarboxylating n=1 Tax=Selenomonas ruminantium subsp. lactilytica (strain NBRC 103574 / TAM6421) TaxID=927704 RepID=I0GM05_SELRL|nr:decarboxylating NADP(+)-dependent phosphogluconate dehydrogenase [Selenomonas ruminantium]BAL81792.1 putative 6-phosphogluconate dehydrogenase, decarboxylating [Selenomonas ruminantium subsp. lactilytica TAM6421]